MIFLGGSQSPLKGTFPIILIDLCGEILLKNLGSRNVLSKPRLINRFGTIQTHPVRVRGLKLASLRVVRPTVNVAPRAGAWIETFRVYDASVTIQSQNLH